MKLIPSASLYAGDRQHLQGSFDVGQDSRLDLESEFEGESAEVRIHGRQFLGFDLLSMSEMS